MSQLVITGVGLVGPGESGAVPVDSGNGGGIGDGRPLPAPHAFLAEGFDPVALLGRKTSRFNHRTTLLAMAACGAALADAELEVTDEVRDGIGITVGTTYGSMAGAVRFGWDTFAEKRPYNVNPANFPNVVMNTAAGASAIKYGLRGANSTIAGGAVAGLAALRYAAVTLRACHADTIVVGAAEEYSVEHAWFASAVWASGPLGEGAAMFVLEREDIAAGAGRRPMVRLANVSTVTADVTDPASFRDRLTGALESARVPASAVRHLALRRTATASVNAAQELGVASVVTIPPAYSEARIGDCFSAHAAMQLAEVVSLARTQRWTEADAGVVLAADPDGALGVVVVTGVPHPGEGEQR
jgi:3-oxoacyl-[acyl-carrier-protein] synthase II